MRIPLIPLVLTALFLASTTSWAEDRPFYENGVLTLPSVDSPDGASTYQDAEFAYHPQTGWTLRTALTLGGAGLAEARVTAVELIRTDTFPVQVLLRASGPDRVHCSMEYRAATRRDGNHFIVQISQPYLTGTSYGCTADVRNFKKSVPLPVYGLPAGSYTYDLNGYTGGFELTEENAIAGDCGYDDHGLCPPPGYDPTLGVTP